MTSRFINVGRKQEAPASTGPRFPIVPVISVSGGAGRMHIPAPAPPAPVAPIEPWSLDFSSARNGAYLALLEDI